MEILFAAVEVESLDAGIEVDQTDRHAADADNGKFQPIALPFDLQFLFDADVERIGEDIDRVEAELFRLLQSPDSISACLNPSGVD